MSNPKIEVYQNAAGDWAWRLRSANGKVQASGEGYTRHCDVLRGVAAFKRAAALAVVKFAPVDLRRFGATHRAP